MDSLSFVASVIASLAWPVSALVVLFVIARNGRTLAKLVKTVRLKDLELTLRDDFDKARDIAGGIDAALADGGEPKAIIDAESELLRLAKIDPAVAILWSWKKLDAELIRLIQHNGQMRFTSTDKFMRRLIEVGKVTAAEAELYHRLRKIRNEAVHVQGEQRPLTIAEVVEYDQFVEQLVDRLERIRNEPGYIDPE